MELANKIGFNDVPGQFIEGIHPPWMRAELPEIISGIPYVSIKEKRNPNLGLYCVDGYYIVKKKDNKSYPFLRMLKEYQAKSSDEAVEMAKKDGLARGLLIEQILGEAVKCNLGEHMHLNPSNIKNSLKSF